MNKAFILLLLGVLLLHACDVQIQNNARLYVTGAVTDTENNPLADIDITLADGGTVLGNTETETNGMFELTSLRSNAEHYDVTINALKDTTLTSPRFIIFNTQSNEVNLPPNILERRASFTLTINRSSSTNEILDYSVMFTQDRCVLFADDPELNDAIFEEEGCYERTEFNNEIGIEDPTSLSQTFNSIQGSSAVFTYQLGANDTPTSVEIPLTNATHDYVFEY